MKQLAYRLSKQQADSTIYKIRDPETKVEVHEIYKIKDCFKSFYEKLYSQPYIDNDQKMESLLNRLHLPTLTDDENKTLMAQITKEEIQFAIGRLKVNKTPGTDGFTAEWYKKLREALTTVLLKTFNWVLTKGEAPSSWKQAIISIIPKEGKDKLECSNYRPKSILNLDYKLFAIYSKET